MNYDIEKDLYVDLDALDDMIKDQPSKLQRYTELLADAKGTLADHELQLSVKTAQLEKLIRNGDYGAAGDLKITEGAVKALLASDEALIKLQTEVNRQKTNVYKLSGIVDAFHHRKHSINNAITLWISNYYSDSFKPKQREDNTKDAQSAARSRAKQTQTVVRGME